MPGHRLLGLAGIGAPRHSLRPGAELERGDLGISKAFTEDKRLLTE